MTNERTTTHRETRTVEPGVVTQTEIRTETVTETVTKSVAPSTSANPDESVGSPLVNEHVPVPTTDAEAIRSALPQVPGQ